MKAVRVHQFGGLESIVYEDVPRPSPGPGQVLVRVRAAGVGPWDAWVRERQSALHQPLPLILGSDLSGTVEEAGPGVGDFVPGDRVFGVTNAEFTGAYAEYALADTAGIARTPERVTDIDAASVPVVATTAWQMLFDHGAVGPAARVLILGAAGNVGAYAVQFAKNAGAAAFAAVNRRDVEYARALGADTVLDVQTSRLEDRAKDIDVVIDTVGGELSVRSLSVLKPGGILVSAVTAPDPALLARHGVRGVFFIVRVTTDCLNRIGQLLSRGTVRPHVGEVLPLSEARKAHVFLSGMPHKPGKIVLRVRDE